MTPPEEGKCNNYNLRKNEGVPKYIIEGYTVSDFPTVAKGFAKTDSVSGLSTHFVIK